MLIGLTYKTTSRLAKEFKVIVLQFLRKFLPFLLRQNYACMRYDEIIILYLGLKDCCVVSGLLMCNKLIAVTVKMQCLVISAYNFQTKLPCIELFHLNYRMD